MPAKGRHKAVLEQRDTAWTNSRFLSVDPGLTGTGWAAWDLAKLREPVHPICWGIIKPQGSTWVSKARDLYVQFGKVFRSIQDTAAVHCECPQFMPAGRGYASAGEGNLVKLSVAVGVIAGATWQEGGTFNLHTVSEWKGQLTKELVERRVCKILGPESLQRYASHEVDAVGLGLFVKGLLH